ncbi:MAG: thiolase family protein [Betaproteobacteria bacterium]|nr:thiolase family protein [Betaproteobacteria bacterium]
MRKAAIIGTGTLPWRSRYLNLTDRGLAYTSVKLALEDAGITKDRVDSVIYSIFSETVLRQQIPAEPMQDTLGFDNKRTLRIEAGNATGLYALYAAYAEVASGMSDIVLVVGIQKGQDLYCYETHSRGDGFVRGSAQACDTMLLLPVCASIPAYLTTTLWLPHLKKYGGPTPEQAARFSSMCHRNAADNPEAQLQQAVSPEEVMASRIIAWPTTMLQCCLYSDASASLVIASEKVAAQLSENPVWISGIAVSSYPSTQLMPETVGRIMGLNIASKKAYQMAGIANPVRQLDLCETYDLISAGGVISLEELGLCELGQGGRLVDEGVFETQGQLPVNVSGGRVACGHVGGVSDIYSSAYVANQLRGRANGAQVKVEHGRGMVASHDEFAGFSGAMVLESQRRQ